MIAMRAQLFFRAVLATLGKEIAQQIDQTMTRVQQLSDSQRPSRAELLHGAPRPGSG